MAAEDLPSEFDVVILGTGLAESVVAAAFSRVGQKVLHLDRRSYYAANWASFTFNSLLTWIQQHQEGEESQPEVTQDWSSQLEEGEGLIHLSNSGSASIRNVQAFCFTSEEDEEEEEAPPTTTEEEDGEKAPPTTTEEEDGEKAPPTTTEEEDGEKKAPPTTTEEDRAGSDDETTTQKPEEEEQAAEKEPGQSEQRERRISYAQLLKEGRRFNIDLVSKLLYSRGSLVDLLIKSNVSRYAEFKNVTRILTYRHGNVEQVPCSRADVFASRQLSVVEKRKLMRFLTSCAEETEEQRAYDGRPYMEFLRDQQLGDNLQDFLLHSIAMVTEATPTEHGLASTRHFLRCLGRYGNTPFLFPVYGLGEIPQCFCRMSAVFGGIYCLRHSVTCMVVDKETNRCKAVIDSRGQRISCSHFVVEEGFVGAEQKRQATPPRFLSRAVLITDRSLLPSDSDQQVSMVTVPPTEGCPAVKMVELCPATMTCMPGTYLVHLTCQSVGSAHQDLSPVVTRMFSTPESPDQGPSVLWCVYFNLCDGSLLDDEDLDLPSNVYVCSGPDGALGHDHAVGQAQSIFQKVLPDEDFCPPAPNPEDIIYDGDASSSTQQEEHQEEEENQEEEKNQEEGKNQEEEHQEEGKKEEEEEQNQQKKKKEELQEEEEEEKKKKEELQEQEEEEKKELQEEEQSLGTEE